MKKTKLLGLIVLLTIFLCLNVNGAGKKRWVKILPSAKMMQQISISAEPEVERNIPLQVKLGGIAVEDFREKNVTYNKINAPGAGSSKKVGTPEIPELRRLVKIPLGSKPTLGRVSSKYKIIKNYHLYPVQDAWEEFHKAKKPAFKKDDRIYKTNAFFPKSIVRLGKPAMLRGIQVVPVLINPVQYNPVTKELKVHSDIKWKLGYSGAAPKSEREKSEAAYTAQVAPLYQKSIVNYKPPTKAMISKWEKYTLYYKLDYLIITHDKFYNAIQPLANAKKAKGLKVRTVKTSAIKSTGPSAADITNYIKKVYKSTFPRLSYVLLVGDVEYVPTHYGHTHISSYEKYKKVGTDLYYATMDGPSDYLPDLAVGRLPGDSVKQISGMVDKILLYETSRKARKRWFSYVLHCAYFQDNNKDGIADRWFLQTSEEIHNYLKGFLKCTTVYTQTPGSPASKKYRDGVTPVPATVKFTGSTQGVINGMNHGVFLVTHRDHGDSKNGPYGGSDGWGDPEFVTSDAAKLANGCEPPIFFSINCRSGWFDGETDLDGGSTKVDCLGESLMKKYKAGASGFIGSTRISYSGYNDDFTKGLIDAVWTGFDPTYTEPGTNKLGYVLNYAKIYMAEKHGYPNTTTSKTSLIEFEEFNLLGDPEMSIKPWFFILQKYPVLLKYKTPTYKIVPKRDFKELRLKKIKKK